MSKNGSLIASEILIVDDEEDIRDLIAGILHDEGYSTRVAGDSESALTAIRARRPQLVVLDIWLQGSKLDGIEVLALYTLKKTSFTITEIILGINIVIFAIAGFKFGIETALYSILTYFAATRSIDYVVSGLEAYTGITIVSGKSESIKYQLVNKLGRGISVYKGERGFLPGKYDISSDCDIIFTVITRLEVRKLKNLVYEVDPNAFVFVNTIKEASGGVLKKRKLH